jgi:hypothetical protein
VNYLSIYSDIFIRKVETPFACYCNLVSNYIIIIWNYRTHNTLKGNIGANLYFTMTPFKPSDFENTIFVYSLLLLVSACRLSLLLLLPACGLTLILIVPACGPTLILIVPACGLTLLLLVPAFVLRLLLLVPTGTQSLSLANSSVAFRLQHES